VSRATIVVMMFRRVLVSASLVLGAAGVVSGFGASPADAQLGGPAPVVISVRSLQFAPKKLAAKPNQKINFVWKENVAHNIVFDKTHKSPTQNKGSWATSFDKAGTYKFKCTLHPGMVGEVTVK
jgi:plastocyanin